MSLIIIPSITFLGNLLRCTRIESEEPALALRASYTRRASFCVSVSVVFWLVRSVSTSVLHLCVDALGRLGACRIGSSSRDREHFETDSPYYGGYHGIERVAPLTRARVLLLPTP